jgi:y4mF family transcriptional regulator
MLNDTIIFGKLIRTRRRAARLSQRDLAAIADTGERFIVDLEAGKSTSHLGKALAVASALGIVLVDAGHAAQTTDDLADLLP